MMTRRELRVTSTVRNSYLQTSPSTYQNQVHLVGDMYEYVSFAVIGVLKPCPFLKLNHFTVQVAIDVSSKVQERQSAHGTNLRHRCGSQQDDASRPTSPGLLTPPGGGQHATRQCRSRKQKPAPEYVWSWCVADGFLWSSRVTVLTLLSGGTRGCVQALFRVPTEVLPTH
jgi:hypothetical protein